MTELRNHPEAKPCVTGGNTVEIIQKELGKRRKETEYPEAKTTREIERLRISHYEEDGMGRDYVDSITWNDGQNGEAKWLPVAVAEADKNRELEEQQDAFAKQIGYLKEDIQKLEADLKHAKDEERHWVQAVTQKGYQILELKENIQKLEGDLIGISEFWKKTIDEKKQLEETLKQWKAYHLKKVRALETELKDTEEKQNWFFKIIRKEWKQEGLGEPSDSEVEWTINQFITEFKKTEEESQKLKEAFDIEHSIAKGEASQHRMFADDCKRFEKELEQAKQEQQKPEVTK